MRDSRVNLWETRRHGDWCEILRKIGRHNDDNDDKDDKDDNDDIDNNTDNDSGKTRAP